MPEGLMIFCQLLAPYRCELVSSNPFGGERNSSEKATLLACGRLLVSPRCPLGHLKCTNRTDINDLKCVEYKVQTTCITFLQDSITNLGDLFLKAE